MGWDARAEGEGRGKAARGPRTSLHFTNRQEEAAGGVRRDRSLTLVRGNPNPNPSSTKVLFSLSLLSYSPPFSSTRSRPYLFAWFESPNTRLKHFALLVGTSWDLAPHKGRLHITGQDIWPQHQELRHQWQGHVRALTRTKISIAVPATMAWLQQTKGRHSQRLFGTHSSVRRCLTCRQSGHRCLVSSSRPPSRRASPALHNRRRHTKKRRTQTFPERRDSQRESMCTRRQPRACRRQPC